MENRKKKKTKKLFKMSFLFVFDDKQVFPNVFTLIWTIVLQIKKLVSRFQNKQISSVFQKTETVFQTKQALNCTRQNQTSSWSNFTKQSSWTTYLQQSSLSTPTLSKNQSEATPDQSKQLKQCTHSGIHKQSNTHNPKSQKTKPNLPSLRKRKTDSI